MKSEIVSIGEVKLNPNNPRSIKKVKFDKLVRSIREFPSMLEMRPIVVDEDMVVLGGNMRLQALGKQDTRRCLSFVRLDGLKSRSVSL